MSNAYGLGAIISGLRAVIHVRIATQRGLSAPILEAHVHSAGQNHLHDGGDWRCRSPMSWRTVKVAPSSVVNHPVTKGCNLVTVPWVIERRKRDPGTKHTCQKIRPLLQALGLLGLTSRRHGRQQALRAHPDSARCQLRRHGGTQGQERYRRPDQTEDRPPAGRGATACASRPTSTTTHFWARARRRSTS